MTHFYRCFAAWALCFGCTGVLAQPSTNNSPSGITASQSQSIRLKPEKLRLLMWVQAQAGDPKAALESLLSHKDRVTKELTAMKCVQSSIAFSQTTLELADGDQSQGNASQIVLQMAMRNGGEAPAIPKIYTAKSALVAEWPLPVSGGDALALLPATLMEQIEQRDFAGQRNKPKLSAEAAQQIAELQSMAQDEFTYYRNQENESPGAAMIYFVASATDKQIEAATEQAFKAAVAEANQIASATKSQIGKLTSINRQIYGGQSSLDVAYQVSYRQGREFPPTLTSEDGDEVSATSIDDLVQTLVVNVSYGLQ